MKTEATGRPGIEGMEATLETPQAVPLTTSLPGLQMNVQFQYKGCDLGLGRCMGPAASSPSCPWHSQLPPPRATLPSAHPEGWTPTVGQAMSLGPPLLSSDLPDPLANSVVPMALPCLAVCHPGVPNLPLSGFCHLGCCCC